ncbi:MBL fold metallo-hydrolase [Saccharomonospora saliphila]|uniref:MBL fold metallo-hydrolase n=1 Tax=Saccharomonospora saliphila TaxID=369829 RepID=UPI00036FF8BC|nr:MBL fold metallo-hydrolase [Saccharomonospora saliphila]
MLVVGFPVGAFQANCYLLAREAGTECVLVDPGLDAAPEVERALSEHDLTLSAVLLTHGHVDHIACAATVADDHGVAVHIRSEDRHLLTDPAAGLSPELARGVGGLRLAEPAEVVELDTGSLTVAGLPVRVEHTPGHTPGSVVFLLRTPEGGQVALTGDTLFAGSVGRTDMPGGDAAALRTSLTASLLTLDDETVVLPGHGGSTTIGRERAANPFLTGVRA